MQLKFDSKKYELFFVFDVIILTNESIWTNFLPLKRYYKALCFDVNFCSEFEENINKMKIKSAYNLNFYITFDWSISFFDCWLRTSVAVISTLVVILMWFMTQWLLTYIFYFFIALVWPFLASVRSQKIHALFIQIMFNTSFMLPQNFWETKYKSLPNFDLMFQSARARAKIKMAGVWTLIKKCVKKFKKKI